MSQHDMVLDNQSRTNFRQDLNNALQALATQQAGSGDPATTYGYQTKIDISPLPTNNAIVYIRKSDNSAWQRWAEIDKTTGRLLVDASSVPAFLIEHNTDGTQKGFAVSGTNTYTATIGITAYTNKQAYDVVFVNASTAASTLNIDSIGAKKLYIEVNGTYTQVGNGDIFVGMHASISYDSSLDSAAGGFVIRNRREKLSVDHNTDGTHKQSSFSVHKNGVSQANVVTTTSTKVQWGAKLWDTNNDFATSTFTPTIPGKYHLDVNINWQSFTDGVPCYVKLYKNGALYKQSIQISGSAATQSFFASFVVDANGSTDYFDIYTQQDSGADKTIDGSNSETWWMGYKIN